MCCVLARLPYRSGRRSGEPDAVLDVLPAIQGRRTLDRLGGGQALLATTEDAEALQDGGRAAPAGRQAATSRRGWTSRQLTEMYRPSIRPVARPGSPPPARGTLLVGPLSPLTPFERHFGGGGGVVCRTV